MSGQNKELIDELVSLSTRYGILTPYTSFLADERVPLHAAMQNANRARESLRELGAVSGSYAVAQRDLKQYYMRTDKAAMGGAGGMGGGFPAQDGYGAMMGRPATGPIPAGNATSLAAAPAGQVTGRRGAVPGQGQAAKPALAEPTVDFQAEAAQEVRSKVRQVGSKTFYFKDSRWVDSTVKPDEDAKARRIRQFSDEFFSLARSQSAELNQYLTFSEPVTIKLAGTVYRIDPAESNP